MFEIFAMRLFMRSAHRTKRREAVQAAEESAPRSPQHLPRTMKKASGDRSLSAAVQHRRAAGSFDKFRAEKLQSNVRNGRHPVLSRRSRAARASAVVHSTPSSSSNSHGNGSNNTEAAMGVLPSLGIAVAVAGSMLLVSYAAVLSAISSSP